MTAPIPDPVEELLASIGDERVRTDAITLLQLMSRATGEQPEVWSSGTVGFGRYHYEYASGQEGKFFDVGFAPRERRLTLYIMSGLQGFEDILDRLGPHESGKSTVHIKRLEELDLDVLQELVRECVRHLRWVEKEMGAIPRMSEIPPRDPAR